jgi:hypothetical protein
MNYYVFKFICSKNYLIYDYLFFMKIKIALLIFFGTFFD